MSAIFPVGWTILLQLLKIRFVLLPGDIPSMGVTEEKRPLLLGHHLGPLLAIQAFARARSSVAKRTRIARIAQDFEGRAVEQRSPVHHTCVRTGANTAGKE